MASPFSLALRLKSLGATALATAGMAAFALAPLGAALRLKALRQAAAGSGTPAPTWSVYPSISGTPQVGQTATGSDGTISNGTAQSRAWLRNGTPIPGATDTTYQFVTADIGATITYRVTASGAGGTTTTTSDPIGPIAAAPAVPVPSISLGSNGATFEGDSGTQAIGTTVTVTRNGVTGALVVDLVYSGTATAGVDYATPPSSVTIASGQNSVSFDLTINGDTTVESSETIIIGAALAAYPEVTASRTVTLSNDDSEAGTPTITMSSNTSVSDDGELHTVSTTVTATRNGVTGDLLVDLTYGGTAVEGVDYTAGPSSVTIPSGQNTVSFDVETGVVDPGSIPAEILLFIGNSIMSPEPLGSAYDREAEDTNWPDVYQRTRAGAIVADTTPPDYAYGAVSDPNGFSQAEYTCKIRQEATGRKIFLQCYALGGSSLALGDTTTSQWQVGGALHEAAITNFNADIAAIQAAYPGAIVKGVVEDIGSNDYDPVLLETRLLAHVQDLHDRIFMNGVSGETLADALAAGDAVHVFMSPQPERTFLSADLLGNDWAIRDVAAQIPGGMYYHPVAGLGDLHPYSAGKRSNGIGVGELIGSTTPTTFDVIADYSIPADGPYIQELTSAGDKVFHYWLTGTNASSYEIVRAPYTTQFSSDANAHRSRFYVQRKSGVSHTSGTHSFTINGYNGSRVLAQVPCTVVAGVAPYTNPSEMLGSALIGWFDAADVTNGAVTTLPNKVATTYMSDLTQATSGNRPVKAATSLGGTKPGITFDGADDILVSTLTGMPSGVPVQAIVVWQPDAAQATNDRLVSLLAATGTDADNYIPLYYIGTEGYSAHKDISLSRMTASAGSPHVIASIMGSAGPTSHKMWVDGVAATASGGLNFPNFVATQLTLGGDMNGGASSDNIPGVFGAAAFVLNTITDARLTMLTSYLKATAGI